MNAVTKIQTTAQAAPPILHPPPVRASAWNKLFAREGWTCLLVSGDLLASLVAVLVALVVTDTGALTSDERLSVFAFCLLVPALLYVRGVYRRRVRVALHDVAPMIGAVSVAAMAVVTWDVAVLGGTAASPVIGRTWLLTFPLLIGTRGGLSLLRRRARARGLATRNTLIVGAGVIGATVAQRLAAQPEYGLRPVGFLDDDPSGIADGLLPVLGSPYDLDEVAATWSAEHVVFAFAYERDQRLMPLVSRCEELGLEVSLVPRLFESINDRASFDWVGSLPLLGVRPLDPKGWQFRLKYALDRPLALFGLILLAPVMAAVALSVKLSSPGPILFRQRRIGQDGQVFEMLKFRSMEMHSELVPFVPEPGFAPGGVEGPDRRTPIGRFLRRSALDELPQLVNVLRGEMSLVGPRPERPEFAMAFGQELVRYTDRHRVKSGITGWAQVCGLRGQTPLADRVDLDNYYIQNWSLSLDLKIALLTVVTVLRTGDA